jgi:hypothetical protein
MTETLITISDRRQTGFGHCSFFILGNLGNLGTIGTIFYFEFGQGLSGTGGIKC